MLTNDEFIGRDCIHGNPRLEVCYAIAAKSHEGQVRRNKQQPYIVHPMLVCNLVDAFGGSEAQKAVALLHDVIEDNKEYNKNPERLKADLLAKLNNACKPSTIRELDELTAWTDYVFSGVEKLSLGRYRVHGSKRATQVDAVEHIAEEWRQVKMLDQAATVIGDILHSDPHNEEELIKSRYFVLKGWDVTLKCCGDDIASKSPYYDFYNRLFNQFREYYKDARAKRWEKVQSDRQQFNVDATIADAFNADMQAPVKPERVDEYYAPFLKTSTENPPVGLAHVTLSRATGKVVAFGLVVSPNKSDTSPDNRIAADIREALERRMTVGVATGDLKDEHARADSIYGFIQQLKERILEQHPDAVQVRNYKVSEPIGLPRLIRVAKAAGGLDWRFEHELRSKVTEFHRERMERA